MPIQSVRPINQLNIKMQNNNDIFSGLPPSSCESIEMPTIQVNGEFDGKKGKKLETEGDTISQIEKVLNDAGGNNLPEKNTIDCLMDEMKSNAQHSFDNSANIEVASSSFYGPGENSRIVKQEDQQAIKDIRTIVQTFDSNEIGMLLKQVEEELNGRVNESDSSTI